MTDVAMKASWNEQIRREPAAAAALAVFVGSAATIPSDGISGCTRTAAEPNCRHP